MDKPSEASAFIAVLLTFFGLSDLTAASLEALPALEYWLANVPVRLTVLFGVTAYSWLFAEGGYLGPTLGAGRHLCNSWVFTFAFLELMIWYWVSDNTMVEQDWSRADFMVYRFSFRSGRRGRLLPTRSLQLGRQRRTLTLCESLCREQRNTNSPKEYRTQRAHAAMSGNVDGISVACIEAEGSLDLDRSEILPRGTFICISKQCMGLDR
jgi:hypothetical protein